MRVTAHSGAQRRPASGPAPTESPLHTDPRLAVIAALADPAATAGPAVAGLSLRTARRLLRDDRPLDAARLGQALDLAAPDAAGVRDRLEQEGLVTAEGTRTFAGHAVAASTGRPPLARPTAERAVRGVSARAEAANADADLGWTVADLVLFGPLAELGEGLVPTVCLALALGDRSTGLIIEDPSPLLFARARRRLLHQAALAMVPLGGPGDLDGMATRVLVGLAGGGPRPVPAQRGQRGAGSLSPGTARLLASPEPPRWAAVPSPASWHPRSRTGDSRTRGEGPNQCRSSSTPPPPPACGLR